MNKPDMILVGKTDKTSFAVKFYSSDIERAVSVATQKEDFTTFAPDQMMRFITLCQRDGYEHYRLPDAAYDARICVQRGFDVDTAKSIAKLYLSMVREALT